VVSVIIEDHKPARINIIAGAFDLSSPR
jgi:hypothetical protein